MEITITWKDKYSTLQNDRKINRSVAFHSFIYLCFHLSQCFHLANNLLWFIFSFKTSVVPCIVILKQISDPTHPSEKDSIPTAPCLGTFEGSTLFQSHDSCALSPGCQGLHNVSSPPPSVRIFCSLLPPLFDWFQTSHCWGVEKYLLVLWRPDWGLWASYSPSFFWAPVQCLVLDLAELIYAFISAQSCTLMTFATCRLTW